MATTPSIQSYFPKKTPSRSPETVSVFESGFTTSELSATNPLSRAWDPPKGFKHVAISRILQGKGLIHFAGRLVNFRPAVIDKHSTQYVRAWHYLIIKDDSGAIGVKLMPLGIPASTFVLGQLLSVWATYICEPQANQESVPYVLTCTSINPRPGTRQFIRIEVDTPESWLLYRVPLDCAPSGPQPHAPQGLVTLASYVRTGYDEVRGLRILVCVRSIGARKRIRSQTRDTNIELQEVVVFDHSASCVLSLWETQTASAAPWKPNNTILLLTSPRWKSWNRPPDAASHAKGNILIGHKTLIDVDPDFVDATWLRKWAKDQTRRESVHTPFPSHLWDVQNAMYGPVRALFTIAEVDEFARAEPESTFTGKLSLVVLNTNLADLWFKKSLCCIDCCGVPLFANSHVATCKQCLTRRELSMNPRIVGTMADETGCLEKGKLIWNPRAWRELFFPEATPIQTAAERTTREGHPEESDTAQILKQTTAQGLQSVKEVEALLQSARITLTFGWSSEVGKLCVLGVEW